MRTEEHPLLRQIRLAKGKLNPVTEEEWFEFVKHMMIEVCVLDWMVLSEALKDDGCPVPQKTVIGFMTMNTPFKHEECIKKGCPHIFDWMEEKRRASNGLDIKIFDN